LTSYRQEIVGGYFLLARPVYTRSMKRVTQISNAECAQWLTNCT